VQLRLGLRLCSLNSLPRSSNCYYYCVHTTSTKASDGFLHLVIGGAGFIGSVLSDKLLIQGVPVVVLDNDLTMRCAIEEQRHNSSMYEIWNMDISSQQARDLFHKRYKDYEIVIWHLAANSDIQSSATSPDLDYEITLGTTIGLVSLIDGLKVSAVFFASTSAVYGDLIGGEYSHELSSCTPISYYGAMKLASENILSIASERMGFPLTIFRFANIVGMPSTHGVLHDFIERLIHSPEVLKVLGNGSQSKTYLHAEILADFMIEAFNKQKTGLYNVGPGDDGMQVSQIAELLQVHFPRQFRIEYGVTPHGWPGDVVTSRMNVDKMKKNFLNDSQNSAYAVHRSIHEMLDHISMAYTCPESFI
jgi:UDP-glucose 4-epimerase